MQSNFNCPKCNTQFNLKANQPHILQCRHDLCKKCCLELFQKQQKIICYVQNCGQQTLDDPLDLEVNADLIFRMKQNTSSNCKHHSRQITCYCFDDQQLLCQKCIETNPHTNHKVKEIFEAQQELKISIPQSVQNIKEKQNIVQSNCQQMQQIRQQIIIKDQEFKQFIQQEAEQAIELINSKRNFYYQEHQELTDELLKEIDKRCQDWQEIQNKLKEQNVQLSNNPIEIIQLHQKLQDILKLSEYQIQEKELQQINQIKFNEYNKIQIHFQINVQQFHNDLQTIIEKGNLNEFKTLLFAVYNTNSIVKYNVEKGTSEKFQVNTQKFGSHFRALQMAEDTLVVIGSLQNSVYSNRISLIKDTQVQEYQMITQRRGHSLAFDKQRNQLFIISGYNGQFIKESEVFNLKTLKSQKIADIPEISE